MSFRSILPMVVLSLTLSACGAATQRPTATSPTNAPTQATAQIQPALTAAPTEPVPTSIAADQSQETASQPAEIKGSFTFSNDILLTYYVEHAVSLTDFYGFVKRDQEWEIPVASQNLGFAKIDAKNQTGTFSIQLPERPQGTQVDVNPDGKEELGVQVFAAEYMPNLSGGPYAEGDDASRGWPSYLASVKTDSENKEEVIGGKLVIWSPDDQQFFPSGYGPDNLLFTQDDPVMPVPQGYSVIDLDQDPFQIIRDASAEMTLYEPADVAIKDFSKLSYKEAFDKMFTVAREEYAFNGIEGKQPDWDALYAKLAPLVQAAEEKKDAKAYFEALRAFTLAFHDGHVGLDGGDVGRSVITQTLAGGYGFAIIELDDGRVMVVHVVQNSPAEKAGLQPGDVITKFNDKPVGEAISEVQPVSAPFSTPSQLRLEQARYLVRAPIGTKASVTFTSKGGSAKTVELEAIAEQETLSATSPFRNTDPNGLPVEYVVASSSIGYIKINSNYDDLNLIVRLFQRALNKFKENNLSTLIIDLRANSGGANLGLAGFLTENEIPLGQLKYYSEKTGKFQADEPARRIRPNEEQYHFEKMFVLVDQACASACELEAYGFSQVPGMVVVGEHPTSGTEAEVSRGQFKLPEGMSLQLPTGRFVLPDGSIFLEGQGVQPTVRVPVTEESVLSSRDPVIQKVIELMNQ